MKKRRYSEAQIFRILKEVETGVPVVNAAREHEVSPATIHRWRSRYGGMTLSELKRLKALEEENAPDFLVYYFRYLLTNTLYKTNTTSR